MNEFICKNRHCGWVGTEILRAPDPFEVSEILTACPQCRGQNLTATCDMEGCNQELVAGVKTDSGYKRLCRDHYREHRQLVK